MVAYPAAATSRLFWIVLGIGLAGWSLLVIGLAGRWAGVVAWGLAGIGAEYALYLRLHGRTADERAAFVAAALIVTAELAYESITPGDGPAERALLVRRALLIAIVAAMTVVVGELVLVAAGSVRSGLLLEGLGVAAAVAAVAAVARLASRTAR